MPDSSSYGIFLSYRREDTTAHARLLQSELTGRFPDSPVFMDLDSIEPGLDFVEVIERALGSCAVLVVLMGRQWATLAGEGGQRRLDDPDDFVRSEVHTALESGVRVIPVLVDGARPVRRQELPDELQKLARLNALELSSGRRYRYDADQLFDCIQRVLAEVKERAEAERQAGEEAARVEAERKAREEAARVEAERKAARLAQERLTDDDSRTVAAEILRSDKPPPTPPRLELSATAVDFGRIAHRAQSPERRIRLHNAGGGSLNARAASEAKWLKLRLEGDELALTVDTARVGRHEYILAVDSDGGSGSVLVQVIVEPARQPPAVPLTTFPRPSPREQAVPGVQQPTGTLGGSPAPPVTAPDPTPPVTAPEPAPPSAPPMVGGGAGSDSGPDGKWRELYTSHFPILGSIMIAVPLSVLATLALLLPPIYAQASIWVMMLFGLAGIVGSVIDYRNGSGVSAVAVGINSAWLAGYAGVWLLIVSLKVEGNVNFALLMFESGGVAFIANVAILTYILHPFWDNHKRTIDRSLLAFLLFMTCGFAAFSISGAVASQWLVHAAGVLFSAALLAELTGIVLILVRVVQTRRAVLRVRK